MGKEEETARHLLITKKWWEGFKGAPVLEPIPDVA